MEIKPPSHSSTATISKASSISPTQLKTGSSTPPQWQIAQQIQAVITKITDKQILLDINGVKAHAAKPGLFELQAGDILKLQINQLKPSPQFTIVGLQKPRNFNAISQYIKPLPPSLNNSDILLKNISYVANRPALRPSPLPVEVNAMIRDIFKNIPAPYNLKTGTQLKTQLQNSGLYFESKIKSELASLAAAQSFNKGHAVTEKSLFNIKEIFKYDLSAQLHRLASLLKQHSQTNEIIKTNTTTTNINKPQPATPHQPQNQNISSTNPQNIHLNNIPQREEAMQALLRQVESNLVHLQQSQLQNLNESHSGRPTWLIELPVKNGPDIDLFQLKINEEEPQNVTADTKKIWNVILKFNLQGLGEVKTHIKMYNDIISAQFISDNAKTLALFNDNFDLLRGRLNYNGLNVGNIECRKSKLTDHNDSVPSKKLDERT